MKFPKDFALKMAADAAHANGIWIGICGEIRKSIAKTCDLKLLEC